MSPVKYPVFVEAIPKDATISFWCNPNSRMQWNPVYEERKKTNESPAVFFQKHGESCKVKVEKLDYKTKEIDVEKKINPAFIQNIVWAIILFPPIIDMLSGHWKKPDTKVIKIQLESDNTKDLQEIIKNKWRKE